MRIAYFDCFSGISGDMAIAAFLDAGLDADVLSRELKKLGLEGYELKVCKAMRGELSGTKFDCTVKEKGRSHRSLKEIIELIDRSSLNKRVKDTAKDIFKTIGRAETKVHGADSKRGVRLHELGETDSVIDIVGVAIALDELAIDEIRSSSVTLGRTIADTRAGILPIPSPASLELLKGIPTRISDVEAELVTPTGAGILKTLSKGFGAMPQVEISDIGYGAGSMDLQQGVPNMLRVIIGELKPSFLEDRIFVIETNIDDMNPQNFEYLFEKLLKEGALDVYTQTIQMKKSRPAFKLTVLVEPRLLKKAASIIFSETTTIGVRFYEADRFKLERRFVKVNTKYGRVKVKLSSAPGNIMTVSPEYEECAKLARKKKAPFKTIYEEAKRAVPIFLFFMVFGLWSLVSGLANADTIHTNDGKELKGIVVEEYKDRLTFSTADGEVTVMKQDISELSFDSDEDNLIKLAELAQDRKDYIKAYAYYNMASKLNPDSKRARDGIVFLQGYLFRKEEDAKEESVKKQEAAERFGASIDTNMSDEEEFRRSYDKLKKSVGITLEMKGALPELATVEARSPAYEAGMRQGDLLVAVWGRLTGYMSLKEVMDLLLKKAALEIKCTIERTIDVKISDDRSILAGPDALIGASFSMEFDGLTASDVAEDGSSFEAGLKKEDLITAIDAKPTRYIPLKNAVELIRNSKENSVKLTIRRELMLWRKEG